MILADILTYAPGEGKQLANLVCDNVVEHLSLEEIDRFFQNLKRIVAPGGKMLVVVPGKKGFPRDPTHKTFITAAVMGDVCRRHSLALEKVFYLPINLRVAGDYFYLNMAVFTVVF